MFDSRLLVLVIAPPLISPLLCCPVLRAPSRHRLDLSKALEVICHLHMCSMPLCAGPVSSVPFVLLSLRAQLPLLLGRSREGTRALQELLQYCQDKAGAQHAPGEGGAPEGESMVPQYPLRVDIISITSHLLQPHWAHQMPGCH